MHIVKTEFFSDNCFPPPNRTALPPPKLSSLLSHAIPAIPAIRAMAPNHAGLAAAPISCTAAPCFLHALRSVGFLRRSV
ncbi:hypothetical protein GUJ93_ZPchr0010g10157 [Zizania palustris]|uniref:Uncharacterized protein n=1 Tax=Zizania palustris TaxID=103762 RepID=A0A8J5SZ83_ZIZPA|nr:hypothetical protein GUJ93_ZPchr0010g10157 [Zizania palustris]